VIGMITIRRRRWRIGRWRIGRWRIGRWRERCGDERGQEAERHLSRRLDRRGVLAARAKGLQPGVQRSRTRDGRKGPRIGPAGLAEIETAAKAFVQVEAGSSAFEAWAAALYRGGVNLPWPDAAKYVWLPSEWPPDEREREDALRDEAAEIMGVEG
jgi:hypothetical protein